MSKNHLLDLHFKVITRDITVYVYTSDNVRLEITVHHGIMQTWSMTVRILKIQDLSFTSDALWKSPETHSMDVDEQFSFMVAQLRDGISANELERKLFLDNWPCVTLDSGV